LNGVLIFVDVLVLLCLFVALLNHRHFARIFAVASSNHHLMSARCNNDYTIQMMINKKNNKLAKNNKAFKQYYRTLH